MSMKMVSAGSLKPGSYVVIDDVACKVMDATHSKPGKHGSAKARIVAIGLFDNKKREIVMPASDPIAVPIVEKKTAQVLSVAESTANVMDAESYETFDLEIPEDLKGQVVSGGQVLYWIVLGQKVMRQVKTGGS